MAHPHRCGCRAGASSLAAGLVRTGVPSAEPTVSQFLLDWETRNFTQAADLTTGSPVQVAHALAAAYQQLDATDQDLEMQSIGQQGKTAYAQFKAAIDLGGIGLVWSYTGGFSLAYGSSGWRVIWSPSVINPKMTGSEQLAVVSGWHSRSQLLDSAGQPLAVPSQVYQVGVITDQLTHPKVTADKLAAITQISPDQILGWIYAAPQAAVHRTAHAVTRRVRQDARQSPWHRRDRQEKGRNRCSPASPPT